MRNPAAGPVLLLLGVGTLLFIAAATGAYAGLALAERIYALLPPITADADAIGGAALALGGAFLLAGLAHLGMAVALARNGRGAGETLLVAGIVLCAVMGALAVGWAVTALVSAASGSAPAAAMLPAGIGLGALAAGYGWAAAVLLRMRRQPGRGD